MARGFAILGKLGTSRPEILNTFNFYSSVIRWPRYYTTSLTKNSLLPGELKVCLWKCLNISVDLEMCFGNILWIERSKIKSIAIRQTDREGRKYWIKNTCHRWLIHSTFYNLTRGNEYWNAFDPTFLPNCVFISCLYICRYLKDC